MIAQYNAANPQYLWDETGHVGACFSADHHSVFMRIDNNRIRTMFQTYTGRGGEPENLADLLAYSKQANYQPWQKDVIGVICANGNEEEVEYTRTKGERRILGTAIIALTISKPKSTSVCATA